MSLEANKTLVRRYFEEARHRPDVCDEIFAPVVHFHAIQHAASNPDLVSSPQNEKAIYAWLHTVWPDWRMTIDEMLAEGDRVMVRWTFHGTQRGEYLGLPPTHKSVSYAGINIFRIAEGKIGEVWDLSDRLWLWQQLGVLPDTAEFIAQARAVLLSQQSSEQTGEADRA